MRFFSTFLLMLVFSFVQAQEGKIIHGKIVSRSKHLEGVYVSNINTGEALLTEKGGYFKIKAKENDVLVFSGALFIGYRYQLDEEDFKRDLILIPMETNELVTQLDEIVITKITSESLGLIPKGTKRYTPAERRLYTATSASGNGIVISVDAIVNWISGRTKMLKKALVYEKQDMRKDKLLNIVSESKLVNNYSIPQDYVLGFAYYLVGDDQMIALLHSSITDKDKIESRVGELALDFIELIENKDIQKNKSELKD